MAKRLCYEIKHTDCGLSWLARLTSSQAGKQCASQHQPSNSQDFFFIVPTKLPRADLAALQAGSSRAESPDEPQPQRNRLHVRPHGSSGEVRLQKEIFHAVTDLGISRPFAKVCEPKLVTYHFLVAFAGEPRASAAFRSSCSKADAMRSISAGVRPSFFASLRHVATACPTCPAIS